MSRGGIVAVTHALILIRVLAKAPGNSFCFNEPLLQINKECYVCVHYLNGNLQHPVRHFHTKKWHAKSPASGGEALCYPNANISVKSLSTALYDMCRRHHQIKVLMKSNCRWSCRSFLVHYWFSRTLMYFPGCITHHKVQA